ncbi:MAG: hypothetical protein ACI4QM_01605 [Alphaproteobacteria bacterium]
MQNEWGELLKLRYPRLNGGEQIKTSKGLSCVIRTTEQWSAVFFKPCRIIKLVLHQAARAEAVYQPYLKDKLTGAMDEWQRACPHLTKDDIVFRLIRFCISMQGTQQPNACQRVDLKTCVEYPKYLSQVHYGVRPQDTTVPQQVSFLLDMIDRRGQRTLSDDQTLRMCVLVEELAKACYQMPKQQSGLTRTVCNQLIDFMVETSPEVMPKQVLTLSTAEWDEQVAQNFLSKIQKDKKELLLPQKVTPHNASGGQRLNELSRT